VTDAFDVCGPLPTGVTVLEASAGTGKTFTIAALAARYVAEGIPLHQLLMVTFTRMATGELRSRVRERLVSAEHGLERALDGVPPEDDAVVQLLATGSPTLVALRRERLAAALADFDSATIATTHGFCQEVLGGLGVLGDIESDTTFVEDVTDLREEVVDDLYLRKFARRGTPQFSRAEAMEIARAAIDNPAAPVEPADAPESSIAALRVSLAGAARRELDARKRRTGVMTYDDLLTRLSDTLHGEGGELAAARLRARYRVVLVDEFQDTDPVQWRIMRTAFGDGEVTLVLIGDPKQAIYAFRGADVYAYIEAARTAGAQATLTVNRRSDQGLIDAYDALFGDAKLGHEGIVYRQVRAAHGGARLHGAPDAAPLRIRVVPRGDVGLTQQGYARLEPARQHAACDVAADIVGLLRSGAEIGGEGRIRPGHIAVLVRTNRNAARVRDALEAVDVPAVINGAGSVFGTEPAREWLRLLEAIERPAYPPRARSAALTLFFGWTTEDVAEADDDAWEGVHRRLHHWARVLRVKGVASLMEAITLEEGLPERVLAMVDGERRMTDLRHVGELLHTAAMTEQMGATALTAWLRQRVLEATTDNNDEERSRRLESDAEAVQVLTMHRSKGLEFPVVYYPDLWEPSWIPRESTTPVVFHDAAGVRTIDVGLEGPQWKGHVAQHVDEQRGEDLRLAYVALTRAKHQAVVWWAGSFDSRNSALSRLLFARDGDGNVASSGAAVPSDETALARFRALAESARVSVEPAVVGPTVSWPGDVTATAELSASSFDRELDWWWRRTSFSDITAGTYEPHVASEPEESVVDDEAAPHAPPVDDDGRDALRAVPSLLAEMPVGVEVGTLVHRVFESVDFADPDLESSLAAEISAAQARRRVELGDAAAVVAGLRAAIETPLGSPAGGVALREVARRDRLDELNFELPLVGGDDPSGPALTLSAIADVLRADPGPLAGYAERLLDPRLRASVRGYLTGSIDLVLRLAGERFAVVDYKTNWLAPPGEDLTAWHHRPAALSAEMTHSHYVLQALLYTVALHRYLRWRLPGYSAERNLAGVLYLFVRGMTGPETPVVDGAPCGVFTWQPSPALVEALSDVLDRGEGA
jgi:exodeoxyribonuclease V beta subunit